AGRSRRVGEAVARPAARDLRRVRRAEQHAGRDAGSGAAIAGHRDDRHGDGRQDAHHGRSVRRDEGSPRRLLRLRGRRPRRGDRARGEDPSGAPRRCGRGATDAGVVTDLDAVFRDEWGRVLAALIGFLGDFDLAEEAAQEAFTIAAERWPRDGRPADAGAWLTVTARNRAIDRIRRERTLAAKLPLLEREPPPTVSSTFADERLELLFTCCHPA